jgi:hypothetical protein
MSQAGNLLANREIVHVLVADSTPRRFRFCAVAAR